MVIKGEDPKEDVAKAVVGGSGNGGNSGTDNFFHNQAKKTKANGLI